MIPAALLLLQAAAPASMRATVNADERFAGIWLDYFENSSFLRGQSAVPTKVATDTLPLLRIERWQAFAKFAPATLAHERLVSPYQPHAYRIVFVGHREPIVDCRADTSVTPPRPFPPGCVGIGGVKPYAITVTRVLTIDDAGPLPR